MSESHTRNMLTVGADPKKAVQQYSDQFLKDFLRLLRTGHGEKAVQLNRFYQEYISDKNHVHMNATRWSSLTELAKYLGREGICRVEETDKGLHIAWIDTSPEALRRQEALRKKEMQDKGDEEWEQRMLKEQIRRAQRDAAQRGRRGEDEHGEAEGEDEDEKKGKGLQRQEGEKITLSFGAKPKADVPNKTPSPPEGGGAKTQTPEAATDGAALSASKGGDAAPSGASTEAKDSPAKASETKPISLQFGAKPQTKNVFAQAKKNAFGGGAKKVMVEQPKKMSEAERIMREEMERKRSRGFGGSGGPPNKRPRT